MAGLAFVNMSLQNNQTCNRTAGALFCVHVVLQSLHLCYSQSVAIQPCPIIVSRVAILPNPQQSSYLHIVSRVAMMPTSQSTDGSTDASNDDPVSPVPPTTAAEWENRAVDYSWVLQGQPERWKTSINQLHSLSFDVVPDVRRPPSKADR